MGRTQPQSLEPLEVEHHGFDGDVFGAAAVFPFDELRRMGTNQLRVHDTGAAPLCLHFEHSGPEDGSGHVARRMPHFANVVSVFVGRMNDVVHAFEFVLRELYDGVLADKGVPHAGNVANQCLDGHLVPVVRFLPRRRVVAVQVDHARWRVARGVFVYLAVFVQRAFHAKGFVGLDMTAATTASCALTGVGDPAPARFAAAVTARPVAHVQWMADGDGGWTRGVAQESQDVVAAEARRALVAYFVDVVVLPTDGIGCFCCVMGARRCVQRKLVASRRAAQNHSGANGFFFRETKGVTGFGLEVFEWQLILRAGHGAARAGLEHGRQNDLIRMVVIDILRLSFDYS